MFCLFSCNITHLNTWENTRVVIVFSQLPAVLLHFSFVFALRWGFFLGPKGLPFYLESFSFAQDDSLLVCFPSRSSSFCFLSGYFFVALFFLFHSRSSIYKSLFLFEPARSYNWITFVFLAVSFVSQYWLPFVPRTSSRPSLIGILLFCAAVSFVSRTTSFCSTQKFQAFSHGLSFIHSSNFHYIQAYILLFPEIYFFVFTFCLVRYSVSYRRSHSFVLISRCPLLSTFPKQ